MGQHQEYKLHLIIVSAGYDPTGAVALAVESWNGTSWTSLTDLPAVMLRSETNAAGTVDNTRSI
jgi:hypothetical protein